MAADVPSPPVRERPTRAKRDTLKKREATAAKFAPQASSVTSSVTAPPIPGPSEPVNGSPRKRTLTQADRAARAAARKQSFIAAANERAAQPQESPLRVIVVKSADLENQKELVWTHRRDVPVPDGRQGNIKREEGLSRPKVSFYEPSELMRNKKIFHYTPLMVDPQFPAIGCFRETELEPYGPRLNFIDAAGDMFFDRETACHVTTDKGYRMIRANVSCREGRWYWECRITRGIVQIGKNAETDGDLQDGKPHGHVRMGWARPEASLEAPVGFDAYSYGFRDMKGEKVHMSRPKVWIPGQEEDSNKQADAGQYAFVEGDVIGLEIQLPSEELHRKVVRGTYDPDLDEEDLHDPDLNDDEDDDDDKRPAPVANIVRDRVVTRSYFRRAAWHSTKELEDLMNPSPFVVTAPRKSTAATREGEAQATALSESASQSAAARRARAMRAAGKPSDAPNALHPLPNLRTLPRSAIRVYKNGQLLGTAFEDLLAFLPPASRLAPLAAGPLRDVLDDGATGYYPAVSVFRGGAAEVNFGPHFWCPPPGLNLDDDVDGAPGASPSGLVDDDGDINMDAANDARNHNQARPRPRYMSGTEAARNHASRIAILARVRPLCERYREQIVEDIVWDIVDEVDLWKQRGGTFASAKIAAATTAAISSSNLMNTATATTSSNEPPLPNTPTPTSTIPSTNALQPSVPAAPSEGAAATTTVNVHSSDRVVPPHDHTFVPSQLPALIPAPTSTGSVVEPITHSPISAPAIAPIGSPSPAPPTTAQVHREREPHVEGGGDDAQYSF